MRLFPARVSRGVRWRSALAAVAVTAVALAAVAVALVLALRLNATDTLLQQARQRAAGIAADLAREGPKELTGILVSTADSAPAQLISPQGTVQARSPDAGVVPMSTVKPAPGRQIEQTAVTVPGKDDQMALVALGAQVNGATYVVLAAEPVGAVDDAVNTAFGALAVGVPILLLIVGTTVYRLVGRALAPVEAMRREVSAIRQADLSRRVPQPGTEDEVSLLAATMNDMLGRLELAQQSQRRFIADASHELRSPLATLQTHLDVAALADGRFDDEAAAAMSGELARLSGLVDDLLWLARADERGLARPHREVDLDDILDAERIRLRRTTSLRVTASIAPVKVSGDRAQLTRMVRNLTDNAVRHASTSVVLSLRVERDHLVLEVGDDGPGIDVADRERVFQRFVRLDDARSGTNGGLGLAIVAQIVAAHGGSVRVAGSAADGGARLVVELPLPQPPSEASR